MELEVAQRKFIEAWGKSGSEWGINRAMAQIHALLFFQLVPNNRKNNGRAQYFER